MLVGDVRKLVPAQIPPHDVLVGGFPCQSFSNAGRREGLDDDRGSLFFEVVRLLDGCRPRAFLLENVRGLLKVMGTVKAHLCALGYAVHVREFDAALLLPQRRRRVFLVGFRDGAAATAFAWPLLPALRRTADSVLEEREQASRRLPDAKWEKVRGSQYFSKFPGARVLQPGTLAQTLQTTYKSGYLLYSQFVPQSPPATPRYFSPRECARLMGFGEDFELAADEGHAYRQLGNAVAVPLVGALAAALAAALEAPTDGDPRDTPAAPFSAQPEALAVAIELALRAAPPDAWAADAGCWLPPALAAAIGLDTEAADGGAPCGAPAAPAAAGGAYHDALGPRWRRWPLAVVARARARRYRRRRRARRRRRRARTRRRCPRRRARTRITWRPRSARRSATPRFCGRRAAGRSRWRPTVRERRRPRASTSTARGGRSARLTRCALMSTRQ